ncbi:MAG: glycosyltransferase [Limnospira sp. PMC 1279.21]|uniref:glycosyltransferase n=1 Tax=Limnospira sp. PMC 1279.21 TaxID=2981062 RepID=UPI0028E1317C|nr:glycosyltransferase [Limnospira sp. PMC 1279.21]MDT9225496.1 glycosyltransferase [Limnospira sp. PMC 1279.21]
MAKAAVSISAYNRPEYFKQVVESLENNPESSFLDFYFFLDGGQESAQEENAKIITNSSIVNKHIIARHNNWGLGRNMIEARCTLFDVCGYDRVLVLEDDMVLSPYYIGLIFRLLDWSEANFDDVGVVQGWFPCQWNREEKLHHLDKVCVGNPHWWGYALSRKVWDEIKSLLYEYEDRFLKDRAYSQRDDHAIREFYKKILEDQNRKERGLKNGLRLGICGHIF